MTAGELAVVLAAVLCCLGFAALIVVLVRVLDTHAYAARRGRVVARRDRPVARTSCARRRPTPRPTVDEARDDLERFDRVLGSAEAISGAVAGGRPRRPGRHCSTPVIKTAALATGTSPGRAPLAPQGTEIGMMKRMTWFVGGAVAGVAGVGRRQAQGEAGRQRS